MQVDFAEISEDGLVAALLCKGERGQLVALFDGDGNTCMGVVEVIRERYVELRPDFSTWRDGE